jgi:hydrogenase nickel incorporation protein HypA/HybF
MHEMSLAQGVLELIEDSARGQHFSRVRCVFLEIGALAGVEPEALSFCFDAVTRGSIAEGAALEIVTVPGTGWCVECGKTVAIAERHAACPVCGNFGLAPNGGTEMRVKELEVD